MVQPPTRNQYATLGSYRLGPTVGKGTFAKVKIAHCELTKREYAIKIFKKDQSNFDKDKVLKEVCCMNFIKHKNVPAFFSFYESALYIKKNGQKYEFGAIVMEYMQNGELCDYLMATEEGFPEDVARTLFRSLIKTVEDIHNQGLVHRDLKPENLLFNKDFKLKIGDFGLATKFKNDKGLIPLKERCGTPRCIAPEIWSGEVQNGTTVDVWSCGVILFILMTKNFPFDSESPRVTPQHYKFFWEDAEDQSDKPFSDAFKDLIDSMLAFDPSKRATIQQIKEHPWFDGPVLDSEDLKEYFKSLKEEVDDVRLENRQREKEEAAGTKAWTKKMQAEKLKAAFAWSRSCFLDSIPCRRL